MSEVFFSPINIKGPDISAAIGISNISPKIASPVSKGISMPSFSGLGGLVSDIGASISKISSSIGGISNIAKIASNLSFTGLGSNLSSSISDLFQKALPSLSTMGIADITKAISSISHSRTGDDDDLPIPGIDIPGIDLPGIGVGIPGLGAGAIGLSSTLAKAIAVAVSAEDVLPVVIPVSPSITIPGQLADTTETTSSTGSKTGQQQEDPSPRPDFTDIYPSIKLNDNKSALESFQKLSSAAMGMIPLLGKSSDVYQRTYNWECLLPGISVVTPQIIGRYVHGVSFGEYNMDDVQKLRYGAETRGHAGVLSIPKVTIKMWKPVPDLVYTYLMLWKSFIVDSEGFYFPKSNYALTGYILLYDTAGRTVGTYKLINMFPASFPSHNLSYGEESIVSYEIDFNVDRIEYI